MFPTKNDMGVEGLNENTPVLEDVLLQKLKARPADVQLRVGYLISVMLLLLIVNM